MNPAALGPKQKQRKAWLDKDSFMTTLLVLAMDTYDSVDPETNTLEFLDWHPETIKEAIETDFHLELPPANFDRLMAGVAVLTTDLFWQDLKKFVNLVNVIAFDAFDPITPNPATVSEMAWAVTEVLLLSNLVETDTEEFSEDILLYMGKMLEIEGFLSPPDVLRMAKGHKKWSTVAQQFDDDKKTLERIQEIQKQRLSRVETMVLDNLLDLSGQLKDVPLRNGNADKVIAQIEQLVKKSRFAQPTLGPVGAGDDLL